ncbi:type II toxin-antitoxin system PemK/MazF family toxin [candidate division KSB1 bacterium]|nr:type II toxin-antitoxin system PemK/MazF family toxin [candidate division KSB1 bacterium]
MNNPSFPKRGEVWLANLDPTIGSETRKTRPVVIIQKDTGNQYSSLTIAAPVTSGENAIYPVEVEIRSPEGNLENNSLVLLNQIRTLDKRRLIKRLGKLEAGAMKKIDRAIIISLGLIDI